MYRYVWGGKFTGQGRQKEEEERGKGGGEIKGKTWQKGRTIYFGRGILAHDSAGKTHTYTHTHAQKTGFSG